MVHDDDRCAHIGGKMADKAGEGIEASGRTSDTHDWEIKVYRLLIYDMTLRPRAGLAPIGAIHV